MADEKPPVPVEKTGSNFSSWGPIELRISLGEAANALAIVGTGYLVARIIERRQANQRAMKDLVARLCRECMDHLAALSQIVESDCPPGQQIDSAARNKVTRCLQRFSNTIHSIELALKKGKLDLGSDSIEQLKSFRESLRTQITEPLALGPEIDAPTLRQVEGTITQARESVIELEIHLHQR